MGYRVSCETHFDAAHFLAFHEGMCRNIHGHRWRIVVTAESDNLIEAGTSRGMVIDFSDIKHKLREIAAEFDHKLVYERDTLRGSTLMMLEEEEFDILAADFRPTAENFAKYIFDKLKESDLPICSVKVYETPENCAEYFES